jgi:hypothetical protein
MPDGDFGGVNVEFTQLFFLPVLENEPTSRHFVSPAFDPTLFRKNPSKNAFPKCVDLVVVPVPIQDAQRSGGEHANRQRNLPEPAPRHDLTPLLFDG